MPVERVCLQCGKLFFTKPAKVRYGEGNFCSRQCAGLWHKSPTERGMGYTKRVSCVVCGKPFLRKQIGDRFCSRECYYIYNRGENNGNFKGWLSKDSQGYVHYTPAHPEYGNQYLHQVIWHEANPNGICAGCGAKVEHIHHIDGNPSNNELNNLMGLCSSCHWKKHHLK